MINAKSEWSFNVFFPCVFGIVTLLLIIGCATIIHGSRESITVNSSPSGAKIIRQGAHIASTPAVIELKRSDSNIILLIEKEGYQPIEIILNRKVDGWIVGNIVIGGLIGLAIDFITGSAYTLSPDDINVALEELKSQGFEFDRQNSENLVLIVDMQDLQHPK